jgi:hypothetical protein
MDMFNGTGVTAIQCHSNAHHGTHSLHLLLHLQNSKPKTQTTTSFSGV